MRKAIFLFILLSINGLLFAQVNPGQIGSNQSICYGSAPQMLTFTVPPSGGTTPYTYHWQRSNDNGITWTDISGTTASRITFSPPVLGRTAMFRCRVTDDASASSNTNSVTVTVTADITSGVIENDQTIYASTEPAALRSAAMSPPSGGSGNYTYQWQRSNNGINWSDISGATSDIYAPGTLGTDSWFRRFVIDGMCGSTASNSVKISVNQITLFTDELPLSSGVDNFNLGTEFQALTDGYITKVRIYTHESEQGDHIVRLYQNYGIIAGPYTWSISAGEAGWKELTLPAAIPVSSGNIYMVSSTTGNGYYVQSVQNFVASDNIYINYLQGLYSPSPDDPPRTSFYGAHYFRDVVFSLFSPGTAGAAQTICYNTSPVSFSQLIAPTGGTGNYSYQWQISSDNLIWSNIEGAILPDYTHSPLTKNTYFRRVVTSGNITACCPSVLVTVNPEFSSAVIHDDITIYNNTLTNIFINISGGTPPYTINYRRNGVTQPQITDYLSGSGISTGILTTGSYAYELTSVLDATGCNAQTLGNSITVTVSGDYLPSVTNKALVIVNEASANYYDYLYYIKPYLDNFGIPYDVFNSATPSGHPSFNDYALIIFAHKNVYDGVIAEYPVSDINLAMQNGTGLYSFDPNLFNYTIGLLSTSITSNSASTNTINLVETTHFITQQHADDEYNTLIWPDQYTDRYSNNYDLITLRDAMTVSQNTSLTSGTALATMTQSGNTVTLLEISSYESGRIVKWNEYNWASESILGPVYGMDDLLWRSIVWAARKPFVMQGFPPMITMRVDDADGTGLTGTVANDFEWISISNEFGFIPWCGTFNIPPEKIAVFKALLDDNDRATASPHAFSYESSIYYNHNGETGFDPVANTQAAHAFYTSNELKMSKLLIPHYYEIDPLALGEIQNMGIEFLGIHMDFGAPYNDFWINCAPFRIYQDIRGRSSDPIPTYYAGSISNGSYTFFNCITEIRDDQGYEWYITGRDITDIIGQGVRQLTRSFNSMVPATLFTHQDQLGISAQNWRSILSGITNAVSDFNPEYRSLDYAVKYTRAKSNITITNISDNDPIVNISYSGTNDMDTRCYLFTETGGLISSRLILLPQISAGTITVGILK